MTFSSVYEMFNPLTEVRKQHFWDWFSGDSLNSRWSWKAGTGGVVISEGMNNAVDGGYQLRMTNGHIGTYDFANKRQYSNTGAVNISIIQRNHTDAHVASGFRGDNTVGVSYLNREVAYFKIRKTTTTMLGSTGDASALTNLVFGTSDGNRHVVKTELKTSSCEFTLDGVLKGTKTTNLPTAKMQPMWYVESEGSSQAGNFSYVECYNT
jgi:hypothetical protein